MANFNALRETLLLKTGSYAATVGGVKAAPSKSKAGAVNVSVMWRVVTDEGNTVIVWDLLPDVDANDPSKVFWRYDQYMTALNLKWKGGEFNSASFIKLLSTSIDEATPAMVDIGVEKSDGYAPRNRITKIARCDFDTQAMAKNSLYDSETDSALSPDRATSTGEQSLAADRSVISSDEV